MYCGPHLDCILHLSAKLAEVSHIACRPWIYNIHEVGVPLICRRAFVIFFFTRDGCFPTTVRVRSTDIAISSENRLILKPATTALYCLHLCLEYTITVYYMYPRYVRNRWNIGMYNIVYYVYRLLKNARVNIVFFRPY